ncbi:reverse transcriptase-rnase h-integrase [Moniliophthora roreri]|nr:reverse transcriptase-rnase h-integrase [Moniliophthora roreri]
MITSGCASARVITNEMGRRESVVVFVVTVLYPELHRWSHSFPPAHPTTQIDYQDYD